MKETLWEYRYAQRMQSMKSSAIRELLEITANPEIISFGGGLPAPDVFPAERFREACQKILTETPASALQYGSTEGYIPLREMIARHTKRYGIFISASNVLITSGSQQALDIIGKVFINPGDRILVESPTYLGALQAWSSYGAEYITIGIDDDGMKIDELEDALRASPKFIYIQPNFHNPAGVTLSLERRYRLVELANQHGIPIIEDDPYGQLRYEGKHIQPITAIDGEIRKNNGPYSGNVIYLSTFSKVLAPGVRIGSIIGPQEVIHQMVKAKQGMDLHTSSFNQMLVYEVGKEGFIDQHVQLIRKIYKERRDIMLESLQEYMPKDVHWTHPLGGLFLWLTLPKNISTTGLFYKAIQEKVAFVPGKSFFPNENGDNTMRLNFSNASPENIVKGISRLGNCIKKEMTKS